MVPLNVTMPSTDPWGPPRGATGTVAPASLTLSAVSFAPPIVLQGSLFYFLRRLIPLFSGPNLFWRLARIDALLDRCGARRLAARCQCAWACIPRYIPQYKRHTRRDTYCGPKSTPNAQEHCGRACHCPPQMGPRWNTALPLQLHPPQYTCTEIPQ